MSRAPLFLLVPVFVAVSVDAAPAQKTTPPKSWLADVDVPGQIVTACGVTRNMWPIHALLTQEMLDLKSDRCRVLIIGGLDGSPKTRDQAVAAWNWFHSSELAAALRESFALAAVPEGNPESYLYTKNRFNNDGGSPVAGYPPTGTAYNDPKNPEALYLWRWIGLLAPDVVLVIGSDDHEGWFVENAVDGVDLAFASALTPHIKRKSESLSGALGRHAPADVAPIAAVEVSAKAGVNPLKMFLSALSKSEKPVRSPARKELLRRQNRSPIQIAKELSEVYGHNLDSVAYIPALALIGRLRLSELTDDDSHQQDVERIVADYFTGKKPTFGKRVGGSHLSGHLVFGELAARTKKKRYIELTKAAADLGFDDSGNPLEAMPHHVEMSDAVFMGTPILVQTGKLTGDTKYYDMAMRHLRFMLKLNLRGDGLHQHSPLDPGGTAWGRGNGFPALGLALCLTDLPPDSPHRNEMLKAYRSHIASMLRHQDEMGMWHQVVDRKQSYRELTVTCMTTFAMTRGLRNGWIHPGHDVFVKKAWESIKTRIGSDGELVDVCTGTGKQKSYRDYLDRKAILGRDDRGGAMALMVATEIAFAEREGKLKLVD